VVAMISDAILPYHRGGKELRHYELTQLLAERADLAVVGRLMTHKGVDMPLEAIALLHAEGLAVTCRVNGDGQGRAALHYKAEASGIAGALGFRYDVSEQKDVYGLLKAARACVSRQHVKASGSPCSKRSPAVCP
jgi:glycosyltransferase involved in cell wall biosynthesis